MRGAKQIALSIVFLLTASASLQAQSHVPWVTSWQEASTMANRYQRMVLIHFWSNDCPPCIKLERTVYNRPEVIRAIISNYVPLKVNVDQNTELTRYFNVQQWPTDIIVDAQGKVLYRGTSSQDPNRYIATLGQVAAHARIGMPFSGSPSTDIAAATRDSDSAARASAFPVGAMTGTPNATVPAPPATAPYRGLAPPTGRGTMPASEPMPTMRMRSPQSAPPHRAAPSGSMIMNPNVSNLSVPANSPAHERQAAFTPPANVSNNNARNQGVASIPPYGADRSATTTENQFFQAGLAASNTHATHGNPSGNGNTETVAEMGLDANAPPTMPNGAPLAMEGYCCVTLVEHETWTKGDPKWGAVHRGRTYLFAGPEQQRRFLADFDRYAPALSGFDSVKYAEQGTLVDGKRAHGIFYRGQIFLFADEAALQTFWGAPKRFATVVRAEQDRQAARR